MVGSDSASGRTLDPGYTIGGQSKTFRTGK